MLHWAGLHHGPTHGCIVGVGPLCKTSSEKAVFVEGSFYRILCLLAAHKAALVEGVVSAERDHGILF